MTNTMTPKDLHAWASAWAAGNDKDCDAYRVASAVLALLEEIDQLQHLLLGKAEVEK